MEVKTEEGRREGGSEEARTNRRVLTSLKALKSSTGTVISPISITLSPSLPSSLLPCFPPSPSLIYTALESVSMAVRKASLMAVNKFIRFVTTPVIGV